MKKWILDFVKRGLMAMGGGPIVLGIVYGCLWRSGVVDDLPAGDVAMGILTVSLMAFIAAGLTSLYQIERLPLFYAILIHGAVLYLDYAVIYLINGWIAEGSVPFLVFTLVFALGYGLVWLIIYLVTRIKTDKLNQSLDQQRREEG